MKVIEPSRHHNMIADNEGNASFVIAEAKPEDDAEYLCKAQNKFGMATCRADIIVEDGKKLNKNFEKSFLYF